MYQILFGASWDRVRCAIMAREVLIVVTGSIGERHARCFGQLSDVAVSVCEPNDALRRQVAEKYNVRQAIADYDQAALDEFDAVVICTPAPLHIGMSIRALQAGCHVLCEKPLSISLDGVDELDEAIRSSERIFRVAYTWRQHPGMKWVESQLRGGTIGRPLQATIVSGQDFAFFRPAYREIYYAKHETGGGAIQDGATHMVDILLWCFGPARSVSCEADHLALEGVAVEDTVSLTLRFQDNPTVATLVMNQFQKNNDLRAEIAGDLGTVRFDIADARGSIFREGQWDHTAIPSRDRDANYIDQASAFLDAIDGRPSNLCRLDEAADALRVVLAALRSTRQGKRIDLT